MNKIGIISMQFVRPFTIDHFMLFKKIKSLGFDFIELLVPEYGELSFKDTKHALDEFGLDIVLAARVTIERNICSTEKLIHQAGVDYIKYAVECAAELGAKIVGGPLVGNPLIFAGRVPRPINEYDRLCMKDRCICGLLTAAKHAQQYGIVLALEPINRFESDVLCTTSQAVEIIDSINHPNLKMMLDTFHMSIEESSIPDSILLAKNHLVHFQANENHRGFLGTGSINWKDVCRKLIEIDYKGPISLEPFRRDDDRFGVPIAQWRPPHENEDEQLKASVVFINSHLKLAKFKK